MSPPYLIIYIFGKSTRVTLKFSLQTYYFKSSFLLQGINAELRYHIENSIDSSRFSINNKTGVVTTAIQLDREEKNLYNLTVVVEDMGGNDTDGQRVE